MPAAPLFRHLVPLLVLSGSTLAVLGAGCRKSEGEPAVSYRAERIDGSNGFKSHEVFRTSTTAATGYDAYVTWDSTTLFLGLTGQDIGAPACTPGETAEGETCPRYDQGEAPSKYLVYYFDTDPQEEQGTTHATGPEGMAWRLPFHADYYLSVRTDYADSGEASLYTYRGERWVAQDVELDVADNNGSKYLELALPRSALGAPCRVKVVGWVVDTEGGGASYAFWPYNAAEGTDSSGVAEGKEVTLRHYYGFLLIDGQTPNASNGQANLDRPFFVGAACEPVNGDSPEGTAEGSARPFHTIGFTTANDFSGREVFRTSTVAATGYDAYLTWDSTNVYLGVTGSDLGPGDCEDTGTAPCARFETGQSPTKWIAYYFDTDPQADEGGTEEAIRLGRQRWTLPFRADYAVLVRTDGVTDERGYTGVADLQRWTGEEWESLGPGALEIFDNSTSGFLKLSVAREALGGPGFLRAVGWLFDTSESLSYAFWPANAVEPDSTDHLAPDSARTSGSSPDTTASDATSSGGTASRTPPRERKEGIVRDSTVQLRHAYGFVLIDGQVPNASDGQANLDRPFFAGLTPEPVNGNAPPGQSASAAQPYHSIGFTTSNDFSEREVFRTSTDADTGYDAYVTWDATNLYFGATGSDIGPGDCADTGTTTCDSFETGQSPNKWLVYYLDADPTGTAGTDTAIAFGDQSWTLPFRADYAVLVRTDGYTDEYGYTGVADLKRWGGEEWESLGPGPLEVFDNSTSGFLKIAVAREALGEPSFLRAVNWFFDTEAGVSYAYWPAKAPASGDSLTTGAATLAHAYGFRLEHGQVPNASGGLANLDRPFFGPYDCASDMFGDGGGDYGGRGRPFHTIPINGSNSFNTQREAFPTSTAASTGYTAYATWDRTALYLGMTGSNVGGGDCDGTDDDNDCTRAETGQGPDRWLVYYLDTDPLTGRGTRRALTLPDTLGTRQSWRLPFPADYVLLIRSDGQTSRLGHTGVVELRRWDGQGWASRGPCGVRVWDNNGSGYLEAAVSLGTIGYPYQVKVVGWMFGAETAYAYWPDDAASDGRAEHTRLRSWWGFELRNDGEPNDSANRNRTFTEGADDQLPFNTYTLDGRRGAGEYLPAESLGRESPGAAVGPGNPELFVTWDEEALYLGLLGDPLVAGHSDLYVALDPDPVVGDDPRRGRGLTMHPAHERAGSYEATYPFAADLVFRFDGVRRDSSGVQTDSTVRDPAPGQLFTAGDSVWTDGAMPSGVRAIRPGSGSPTEIAIPWSTVEGVSADDTSTIHVVFYLIDAENGIDVQWPPDNPNGSQVAFTSFRSYSLVPGAVPSSDATRSVRVEGGVTLGDEVYANVYLLPEAQQTATLGAHTTVVGELLVGANATLDVGSNQRDPSGYNRLRVGQRLTVRGAFQPREGVVLTFDPAVGYPEEIEPGGGFAVPSQRTEVAGGPFHALTLHNRTDLVPGDSAAASDTVGVTVRGPLTVAEGGQLRGRGRLASRRDSARADSSADRSSEEAAQGESQSEGEGWLDRVARFLRGSDDSSGGASTSDRTPSRLDSTSHPR